MALDPAVVALAGVLVGACATGVVNLFVEERKNKRDHEKWLRDKRYDAYTELLQSMWIAGAQFAVTANTSEDKIKAISRIAEATERAYLISDEETRIVISEQRKHFVNALMTDEPDSMAANLAMKSMRKALSVQIGQPITRKRG